MTDDETPPEAPPQPPPPWREDRPVTAPSATPSRLNRGKLAALVAVVAVTVAFVAAGFLWLRPAPNPIVLHVGYPFYQERPLAPPPFFRQDRNALVDVKLFPRRLAHLSQLDSVEGQDTALVVLSAHARLDDQGRVLVIPPEEALSSIGSQRTLSEFLKAVAVAPGKRRLVILDLFWPTGDAYVPEPGPDVVARIQQELEQVPDPRRLVLLPCSPGQTPLASPELGRSVFGHYLIEGLAGWANYEDQPADQQGVVWAKGLARYLQTRVDRWAQLNRGQRQTPMLLGDAEDFALRSLNRGRPLPHRELAATPPYPQIGLKLAWETRDRWQADRAHSITPWLHRMLETVALETERAWINGGDEAALTERLHQDLNRLEKLRTQLQPTIRPDTLSLAQVQATGFKPDEKVAADLKEMLRKIEEARLIAVKADEVDKLSAKLLEEYLTKYKDAREYDVGQALFDHLVQEPFPRRERVIFLGRIAASRGDPRYAEIETLLRLADFAGSVKEAQWRARTVRKVIEVTQRGEAVLVPVRSFPWLAGALETVQQKRAIAETYFFARGYTSLDEADQLLGQVRDDLESLQGKQNLIEDAFVQWEDACQLLPWMHAWMEFDPSLESVWYEAQQAARDLFPLLEAPTGDSRLSQAEVNQKLDPIPGKAGNLKAALKTLRQPHSADAIQDVLLQTKRPEASPANLRQLEQRLALPLMSAELRVKVWQARGELARRFADKTQELDLREGQKLPEATPPDDPARIERNLVESQMRQRRRQVALLELAGLDPTDLRGLEELLGDSRRFAIPIALEKAWTETLLTQYAQEPKLHLKDRISRLLPGWAPAALLERKILSAGLPLWEAAQSERCRWLADRYRFAALESESPYRARAAFALRPFAQPPVVNVVLPNQPTSLDINLGNRSARTVVPLQISWTGNVPPKVETRILQASDDWLSVSVDTAALAQVKETPSPASVSLPVIVQLLSGAESAQSPRPAGFLVQITAGGRAFFHKVTLPNLPDPERLEIYLSADPKTLTVPPGELRLRPSTQRVPYYLFVRNPSDRVRNLAVEIGQNDEPIPGGSVPITVAPGATKRVIFPGPPAPAVASTEAAAPKEPLPLPELTGPLQIRLLDRDKANEVVASRDVKVHVMAPREYVRVPTVRYEPPSPANENKNKFEVTLAAATPFPGPPSKAELVLPEKRIPGFKGAKAGSFRTDISASGKEVKLVASELAFDSGADEEGYAYVTIDGVERAFVFRTTFARIGEPSTPSEDDRPGLRFRAARFFRTNSKFEGIIEVDNAPAGAVVEAKAGEMIAGEFKAQYEPENQAARVRRVGVGIKSGEGYLEFEPTLRDPRMAIDAVPLRGQRTVQIRLLDKTGKEVLSPVYHTMTFDDRAPEMVAFLENPAQVKKGADFSPRATAADKSVGLSEVVFFFGSPTEDNKLPPGAVKYPAIPLDDEPSGWTAKLPIPADKKGKLDVSLMAVNNLGLMSFAKTSVEVVDFDPELKAPGTLMGVVVEGEFKQANLTVVLSDLKGAKLAERKTTPQGEFEFRDLPPGTYKLSVTKTANQRKAAKDAVVEPGGKTRVRLELYL